MNGIGVCAFPAWSVSIRHMVTFTVLRAYTSRLPVIAIATSAPFPSKTASGAGFANSVTAIRHKAGDESAFTYAISFPPLVHAGVEIAAFEFVSLLGSPLGR